MRALIIAAGRSTRLYPLTANLPKCLLPIDEKAILNHQIEGLISAGVQEVVIVVGYLRGLIEAHLCKEEYPIRVTYVANDEFATTGPVWSLSQAMEYIEAPLVFLHSDVLFEAAALRALVEHPDESVMLYRDGAWDEEAGKLVVQDGAVVEMGKHIELERASGEYLQIAKFGPVFVGALREVLEARLSEGRDGFTIDAFNDVVQNTHVTPFPYNGIVFEIDTLEDYEHAKRLWREEASAITTPLKNPCRDARAASARGAAET